MASATSAGPVVVTGGAGAIGSVLTRVLSQDRPEVRVIDNLSSGRMENLGDLARHPSVRFLEADLKSPPDLVPWFRGASEVWHLAANPDIRRGIDDPRLDVEEGTLVAFQVLDAARRADVPRVLFSSSSVVYGSPTRFPTPEEYGPLLPESNYGAAKLAVEALLSSFCHSYGMRGWIFRFANIIGPGMTHGILYDLMLKLQRTPKRLEVLGDGRQAKSYLRTEDCVAGMLRASNHSAGPVQIYNLGNLDQITVREIAEKVVADLGNQAEIAYTGGPRGWTGDIPKQ
ncbi:MAG TPA: NAD-dependent epimerase/dehydratase family protein, partial [Thermoplasmata archaeon]|nr:NAD-dependent epimerase/dehydratase family protein [Thermoplasmata archaeon]